MESFQIHAVRKTYCPALKLLPLHLRFDVSQIDKIVAAVATLYSQSPSVKNGEGEFRLVRGSQALRFAVKSKPAVWYIAALAALKACE
jgi:streptogramin lyase